MTDTTIYEIPKFKQYQKQKKQVSYDGGNTWEDTEEECDMLEVSGTDNCYPKYQWQGDTYMVKDSEDGEWHAVEGYPKRYSIDGGYERINYVNLQLNSDIPYALYDEDYNVTTGRSNNIPLATVVYIINNITSISADKFKTYNRMFKNCASLVTLDVAEWDTTYLHCTKEMFYGCRSLQSIDVSGWDVSHVVDMAGMFSSCSSLKSANLSGLNTQNINSLPSLFSGCTNIRKIDLSGMNTRHINSMESIFYNCSSLLELDLSGWDLSNLDRTTKLVERCFFNCKSLSTIYMRGCNQETINNIDYVLQRSSNRSNVTIITE